MTTPYRWIVLVTIATCLLFAAALAGWVQAVVASDNTGIVWIVAAVTTAALASAVRGPALVLWVCEHGITLMFGLLGTLVGFMGALSGIMDNDMQQKLAGIDSALATTVAGLVAHLYLLVVAKVLQR